MSSEVAHLPPAGGALWRVFRIAAVARARDEQTNQTRHPRVVGGALWRVFPLHVSYARATKSREKHATMRHPDAAMSGRPVRARTCTCGQPILRGVDADWAGIDTDLDAAPVDNLGEFLAIAQGRTTYDLRPTQSHGSHGRYMEPRTASRISDPNRLWPIHAQHRCDSPLPAAPKKPRAQHVTSRIVEGAPF